MPRICLQSALLAGQLETAEILRKERKKGWLHLTAENQAAEI